MFSIAAGLLVLFAAVSSTHDEREFDAAVMRTLGASSRQLRAVQAAEFALIGALAGLLAAVGATAIGYVLADKVLNLPYTINPWVWLAGVLIGAARCHRCRAARYGESVAHAADAGFPGVLPENRETRRRGY